MHASRCRPGRPPVAPAVAGAARQDPPDEGVAGAHVLHGQRRGLLHLKPGLQQARQARRSFRVAHHGLHGRHRNHIVGARPATLQHHLRGGTDLDGVSERGPRAVQLQTGHAARTRPGVTQGGRNDRLLGRAARSRQRACPAVLVRGSAAHQQRPRAPSALAEHEALARLAAHVTVRSSVESLAPGISGQHTSQLRHPGGLSQQREVHPRVQTRAPAQPQTLARQVQAHQRGGAGRVHAHGLPAEPVNVGQPPSHDAESHARRHPRALSGPVPHHQVVVFHLLHADVGSGPLEGALRQPGGARGALQGLPRHLEQQPLLRVHQGRLRRRRPKGRSIKHAHCRQHRRHAQTGLLQGAPALQKLHQAVQLVRVPAAPGNARNRILVRRRGRAVADARGGRQLRRRTEHRGYPGFRRPAQPRLRPRREGRRHPARRLGLPAVDSARGAPCRPCQFRHHVARQGSHGGVVQHCCGVQVEAELPAHGVAQLHHAKRVEPLLHQRGVCSHLLAKQRPRKTLQLRLHSRRLQRPRGLFAPPGQRLGCRRRGAPDHLAEELRHDLVRSRCQQSVPVRPTRGTHHSRLLTSAPHSHALQGRQPHSRSHRTEIDPQALHPGGCGPAAGHAHSAPNAPLHTRARRARSLPRPPQQVKTRIGGRIGSLAHRPRQRRDGGEQRREVECLRLEGGRRPAQGPGARLAP